MCSANGITKCSLHKIFSLDKILSGTKSISFSSANRPTCNFVSAQEIYASCGERQTTTGWLISYSAKCCSLIPQNVVPLFRVLLQPINQGELCFLTSSIEINYFSSSQVRLHHVWETMLVSVETYAGVCLWLSDFSTQILENRRNLVSHWKCVMLR